MSPRLLKKVLLSRGLLRGAQGGNRIYTLLNRMVKRGRVVRDERGNYALGPRAHVLGGEPKSVSPKILASGDPLSPREVATSGLSVESVRNFHRRVANSAVDAFVRALGEHGRMLDADLRAAIGAPDNTRLAGAMSSMANQALISGIMVPIICKHTWGNRASYSLIPEFARLLEPAGWVNPKGTP